MPSFGSNNGSDPDGGLVHDSSAHLYGTTSVGGNSGYGMMFEITCGDTLTNASFEQPPCFGTAVTIAQRSLKKEYD